VRRSFTTSGFRILLSLPVLLLAASPLLMGAPKPPAPNSTFDLFVALDHQLTVLDQQLQQANEMVVKSARGSEHTQAQRPWGLAAHNMQPTVATILRDSYRLEHTYRPREVRLHRPLFLRLYKRSRMLRTDVRLLSEARTPRWARVVQTRLSNAMVAYVFDFQLVSGGYAALRCQSEQLACCEPVRKGPHGPFSCKWACLKRASTCRSGFPGPQIGPSYEQPLSASR